MNPVTPPAVRRASIDALRVAVGEMFGAERRVRSRDQRRSGELTHSQLRALAALRREQRMTAGELAQSADLNPASITAIVDQLVDAGVVERRRSNEDRRVCYITLTAEGSDLLEAKLALWYSRWEERFADLPDSELEIASRVIAQITGIYDALATRLEEGPRSEA
jgi:DNA-binding MarR family transcriptional regulator